MNIALMESEHSMPQKYRKKQRLALCISIDVEEEGLFGGHYPTREATVANVPRLKKLAPLYEDFKIPLTLLCAHSVFVDRAAQNVLTHLRDNCAAEIGAHLHHWSTPPHDGLDKNGNPCKSTDMKREILAQRLSTLLAAGREFQGAPLESFRMGRWDMNSSWRMLLAELGIKTDSSICPLRIFKNGPDHFAAPPDPWFIGKSGLLEVPITQIPLLPTLAKAWADLWPQNPRIKDYFHYFGALSANPFWHGPRVMRACARLHAARGGKVLSLFWHSSELMPGASPHVPDEKAAERKISQVYDFCRWLDEKFLLEPLTFRQLHERAMEFDFPVLENGRNDGDW